MPQAFRLSPAVPPFYRLKSTSESVSVRYSLIRFQKGRKKDRGISRKVES